MKLAIVGSRGIPATYGGFETFAEEIAQKIISREIVVEVYCDRAEEPLDCYKGIKLRYSFFQKSKNPILFYFDCIVRAALSSDVLLLLGVGGSFFYIIPKLLGKYIITNVDGVESGRNKWSFIPRMYIKAADYLSMHLSDVIIADSIAIMQYIISVYRISKKKVKVIEYGAYLNTSRRPDILNKYGLLHNAYYLVVARLEPENNIHVIIEGYERSQTDKKLVIIGNLSQTNYVKGLMKYKNDRILFLGGIYNREELKGIRSSCFAYIHGHSVGGTNPSLLEAMGSGNITICHDNVFNREVTNSQMYYFHDILELAGLLHSIEGIDQDILEQKRRFARKRITDHYNWDRIADQYMNIISDIEASQQQR